MGILGESLAKYKKKEVPWETVNQAYDAAITGVTENNLEDIMDVWDYTEQRISALTEAAHETQDKEKKEQYLNEIKEEYGLLLGCLEKGKEQGNEQCSRGMIGALLKYSDFCAIEMRDRVTAADNMIDAIERIKQAVEEGKDDGKSLPVLQNRQGLLSYFAALESTDNQDEYLEFLLCSKNSFEEAKRTTESTFFYANTLRRLIPKGASDIDTYFRILTELKSHISELKREYQGDVYYLIGEAYLRGYGVTADREQALDNLKCAQAYDNSDAERLLKDEFGLNANKTANDGYDHNSLSDIKELLQAEIRHYEQIQNTVSGNSTSNKTRQLLESLDKAIGFAKKGREINDLYCTEVYADLLREKSELLVQDDRYDDAIQTLSTAISAAKNAQQSIPKERLVKSIDLNHLYCLKGYAYLGKAANANQKDPMVKTWYTLSKDFYENAKQRRTIDSYFYILVVRELIRTAEDHDRTLESQYFSNLKSIEENIEELQTDKNKGTLYYYLAEACHFGWGTVMSETKAKQYLERSRSYGDEDACRLLQEESSTMDEQVLDTKKGDSSIVICLVVSILNLWIAVLVPILGVAASIATFIWARLTKKQTRRKKVVKAATIISIIGLLMGIFALITAR